MINTQLTIKERITRAKVQLQKQSPFFAHLVMNMKITESDEIPTMGVNFKGNAVYNPEFMSKMTDDQIKGILCHETMHVALLHLARLGKKDMMIWNVAADAAINYIILSDGFALPKEGILPDRSTGELTLPVEGGQKIKINVQDKTANEIYEEIWSQLPEKGGPGKGEGWGGFDEHQYGDDLSDAEQEALKKEWQGKLVDAATAAKNRGKLPGSIERMIDELLNPKLNWKALLYQFITKDIIYNYTMAKPGRRSYSTGVYLPTPLKENLNVAVTVDCSGSVSTEEYQDFVGEICGIASAFQQVNIDLIFWDTQVQKTMQVTSSNREELMNTAIPGGGGTHISCLSEHYEGKRAPQLMVHLTDGHFESTPELPHSKHLFVISKGGYTEYAEGCGMTVRLEE